MSIQQQIFNKTFNPGSEGTTHLNACVGNNGFVDKRSYGTGFAEAVDILTTAIQHSEKRASLDTLIYPICFCARHHVELFLKAQIEVIEAMRSTPPTKLSSIHNLDGLWKIFFTVALATDRRFVAPVEQMLEFVRDIAQIDPTGQTFRYPEDTESVKHLTQTPVINIPVLRSRFMALAGMITDFEFLSDTIRYEYIYGVFTKRLSRSDLEYIAKNLPPHDEWGGSQAFNDAKARLTTHFGISGGEFSRALCAIKTHAEFCSHIGLCTPIEGLSKSLIDNLNLVFNGQLSMAKMARHELVAIESIYEIARPIYLSEEFENVRAAVDLDFELEYYSESTLSKWARATNRLTNGLHKLGQSALAVHMEQHLDSGSLVARLDVENNEFCKKYPGLTVSSGTAVGDLKKSGASESEPFDQ
ncbi:hypothetical protein RBA41_06080 [Massilia sp. CCM 9210]|uniref:hypothetical protein n=1 Tax=Massilia scottii TaxID=3057166 RepID=UPI0027966142|nr:hypothetical protein [Massilia sp. CCM 9210]MDQ1812869.1 hypothetical protein [Massilia sp. CCM 9210]